MSTDAATPAWIPQITRYEDWLRARRGLSFDSYHALWRWSTTELDAFWQSIWDYFDLRSPTSHSAVLGSNVMPGAQWFPGAQVNYVQQVLRHVAPAHAAGMPALISENEQGRERELSWPELRRQVASLALHLKAQDVQPGDRVAAYLPNVPETIVAFLATVSIGAVWSVCAPDMGINAVLDRFRQIEPKVLIAVDGITWAGRDIDRSAVVQELRGQLPTVQHLIVLRNLGGAPAIAGAADLADASARDDAETAAFEPMWLPFDHPLWIVYSSGTTGLPKPIVHSHGGMLVVSMVTSLHGDIGSSYDANSLGERFCWYSSTGWVMWNIQVGGLLGGTTCALFDGSPAGSREAPDWTVLWRFAARHRVTFLGSGAAFYAGCMKASVDLAQCGDLSSIRAIGTTGSPLSAEVQQWGTDQFRKLRVGTKAPFGGSAAGAVVERGGDMSGAGPSQGAKAPSGGSAAGAAAERGGDIWWFNVSGGTDFAGGFIAGLRTLPQQAGLMQCRMLGAAVESWNDAGEPVVGQVGELVCTQPIPSMPLYFWSDPGNARYLASYFETYPPGRGRKPGGGELVPPRSTTSSVALPPEGAAARLGSGPATGGIVPPRSAAAPAALPPEGAVPVLGRPGDRDLGPEAGSVWRHGDWLRIGDEHGQGEWCVIFGRSDATINRHGLRMGTSEIYAAVEAQPEVLDSMVVDLEFLGRASYMPLFVVLRPGVTLDDAFKRRIGDAIRASLSPRFVPDEILQVPEIPRTLSGKKQELPIKKLLLGQPLEKVVNQEAMANPGSLAWYVEFARARLAAPQV
jgi:acetoacetyl-CoA synthetase